MAEPPLTEIVAAQLANPPTYPEGRFEGRGIVICAGGPRYFTCAYVLVHILRNALGCTLPVQIWHLGASELSPAMRSLLRGQGAEIVDAAPLLERHPARINNGWALKPYAVLHSRFAQVLSLDADAIPLAAPAQVFDWPEFTSTGALFWPDRVDVAAENPVWAALGLQPRREIGFETGQFVVDKRSCWASLALTVALNNASETLYRMIHGEKDSFLLSLLLTGQRFCRLPHRPHLFDSDLIQLDPAGAPFIHHRTFSKFIFSGPNRPMFGDALTGAAEVALSALRDRWTGIVFHPPAMSAAAVAMARSMVGKIFIYHTFGTGARDLTLDENFQIGTGRAEFEQHWAIIERDGDLVLQFFSVTRLAIELHPQADGSWAGSTATELGFSARLVANDADATMPFAGTRRAVMPAAPLVAALIEAAGLDAGFDNGTLHELKAALTLLNRSHDDVPETFRQYIESRPALAPSSVAPLQAVGRELAAARDVRLEATAPIPAPIDLLRPGFYDRVY
jgi:hypothetical protein